MYVDVGGVCVFSTRICLELLKRGHTTVEMMDASMDIVTL